MQGPYSHSTSYSPRLNHLSGSPQFRHGMQFPTSGLQSQGARIMHFPTSLPLSSGARPVHDTLASNQHYPPLSAHDGSFPTHYRGRSTAATPIFSAGSYIPPVEPSPNRPAWIGLPRNHYPAPTFRPSSEAVRAGSSSKAAKHALKDNLPENVMEARKNWRLYGHHSAGKKETMDKVHGDAPADSVATEHPTKKIFMGIERKGRELKQQISGEVRKLAGGRDKNEKSIELNPKSFFPRMERKGLESHVTSEGVGMDKSNNTQPMANNPQNVSSRSRPGDIEDRRSIYPSDRQDYQGRQRAEKDPRWRLSRDAATDREGTAINLSPSPYPSQNVINGPNHRESAPTNRRPPQHREAMAGASGFQDKSRSTKSPDPLQHSRQPPDQSSGTSIINAPATKFEPTSPVERAPSQLDKNNLTSKTPTPSAIDFWAEADSTISSSNPRSSGLNPTSAESFWAEADKAIPLAAWKKTGPSLEEWIASLPGIGDGASDSKLFEADKKLKKPRPPLAAGVLRVVNGNAEDDEVVFDEDGNEISAPSERENSEAPLVVDRTLLHPEIHQGYAPSSLSPNHGAFPQSFRPRRLESLLEASRETSLHTTTVVGGVPTNRTLTVLSSHPEEDLEASLQQLREIDLPTQRLYRPGDVVRDATGRLDALEKYWDEQGLLVGSVLKRMLWVVDSLIVKERHEAQKEERAKEMGWQK